MSTTSKRTFVRKFVVCGCVGAGFEYKVNQFGELIRPSRKTTASFEKSLEGYKQGRLDDLGTIETTHLK